MTKVNLKFNNDGLVVAIAACSKTGEVLMQAYMNQEAFDKTIATGEVHYFSRSRQSLWKKGETSGFVQKVQNIKVDCDQDSVLLLVEQKGNAACHVGYKSCFYREVRGNDLVVSGEKIFNSDEVYDKNNH